MMTVKIYDQRLVCIHQAVVTSRADADHVIQEYQDENPHAGVYRAEFVVEAVQYTLFGEAVRVSTATLIW